MEFIELWSNISLYLSGQYVPNNILNVVMFLHSELFLFVEYFWSE